MNDLDTYQKNAARTFQGHLHDALDELAVYEGDAQDAFINSSAYGRGLTYAVIKLAGECGEVCDLIGKVQRGDFELNQVGPELIHELGDVLWYIACISTLFGVNLSRVADRNTAKLADRYQLSLFEDEVVDDDSHDHGMRVVGGS